MLREGAVLSIALIMAISMASADAGHGEAKANPGIVGPNSMFYGLEVAMDKVSMSIGLTSAEAVAAERASEALVASRNNNTAAAEKALKHVSDMSNRSNIAGKNGTSKAVNILGQLKDSLPEQSSQGINNAMNNIEKNVPKGIPGEKQQEVSPEDIPMPPPMREERQNDQDQDGSPASPGENTSGSDEQSSSPPAPPS